MTFQIYVDVIFIHHIIIPHDPADCLFGDLFVMKNRSVGPVLAVDAEDVSVEGQVAAPVQEPL